MHKINLGKALQKKGMVCTLIVPIQGMKPIDLIAVRQKNIAGNFLKFIL
jgi:hypothetical protein